MLTLKTLKDTFSVHRFPPHSEILCHVIPLLQNQQFTSLTATSEELSLVCAKSHDEEIRKKCKALNVDHLVETPFKAIFVEGQLDFSLQGILAHLSKTLAEAKVSIFAISTFDTDWILVRDVDGGFERALKHLGENYNISPK